MDDWETESQWIDQINHEACIQVECFASKSDLLNRIQVFETLFQFKGTLSIKVILYKKDEDQSFVLIGILISKFLFNIQFGF